MKTKLILLPTFLLFIFFIATSSAFAHSGCCSWHGGVRSDGCGCNDGTPLSSTCAPYYSCTAPQQNTAPANTSSDTTKNTYIPPVYAPSTDTPTPIPTDIPLLTFTPTPTMKLTPTPVKKHPHKQSPKKLKPTATPMPHKNWWQWLFGW